MKNEGIRFKVHMILTEKQHPIYDSIILPLGHCLLSEPYFSSGEKCMCRSREKRPICLIFPVFLRFDNILGHFKDNSIVISVMITPEAHRWYRVMSGFARKARIQRVIIDFNFFFQPCSKHSWFDLLDFSSIHVHQQHPVLATSISHWLPGIHFGPSNSLPVARVILIKAIISELTLST